VKGKMGEKLKHLRKEKERQFRGRICNLQKLQAFVWEAGPEREAQPSE
jgi:hypothetical protein